MTEPQPAPAARRPAAPVTKAEVERLTARLAELEAENTRLQEAERARQQAPDEPLAQRPRRGFSWRSFSSALLIVVAAILVPVSVVAGWSRAQLVDEDAFIATFAPLASDPAIQAAVTDTAVGAIETQLDLDGTMDAVFDGLQELRLPSLAGSALELLREPAAQGIHALLRSGVESFVTSEFFPEVWSAALRTSHRALLATVAAPSPDSAIFVDPSGQVTIQLAPIIREVTTHLADNGFPFAASIPAVEASFVVAQSDTLVAVRTGHVIATAAGFWIPVLAVVLLAAGILVARNRRVATAGAAIGIAVGAGAFLLALFVGSAVVVSETARIGISGTAVAALVDHVLAGMRESALDLLIIGVVAAIVALALGSKRLRAAMAGTNARLAAVFGVERWRQLGWVRFIVTQRVLVGVVLVVVPLLLVLLLPLNWAGILAVALVALLLAWFVAILRSGAAELPPVG